jgi:MFS family permease
MQRFFRRLPSVTPGSTQQVVPPDLQRTFHHLYGDIGWYGLLAGTTIAFLGVYAARLGASALQIGLLTAGPALVNLIFTLPIGRWLQSRPIGRSVFGSAVAFRALYLVYALLPLTLPADMQLEALIWATFLFTVPGVALAIGFNALFAAAVPIEWRGMVAGRRNALLSVFYIVASLLSGYILNNTSLEVGYTLIFGLGFVGAAMSTYHLSKLRGIRERPDEERSASARSSATQPARAICAAGRAWASVWGVALRSFTRGKNLLRLEVLRGAYGSVILALFVFHTAQFMPGPLFPLRWVDALHLDDGQIAVGTAFFHGTTLLGSLGFANLSHRFGFHKLLVAGTAGLSLYPLFTAFMPNFFFYALTSIVGGLAWALVGGALSNYLLEKVPADDRPAYLAWYNLALNAAILLGALLGPLLASVFDLTVALVLSFVFRLIGSLLIWLAEPRPKSAST